MTNKVRKRLRLFLFLCAYTFIVSYQLGIIWMNNDININFSVRIRKSNKQNNINSTDGITWIPQTEYSKDRITKILQTIIPPIYKDILHFQALIFTKYYKRTNRFNTLTFSTRLILLFYPLIYIVILNFKFFNFDLI